jgi:hypothetical protein
MRVITCRLGLFVAPLLAIVSAACSSNGSGTGSASSGEVLDPTQSHYGNTDDVWATQWYQWIYQLQEPEGGACINPLVDPTGQSCGYGQSGDVFFLSGTEGGTVVRDQCVVPFGKAIFFPILSFSGDNGGVPLNMQLTPPQLIAGVQSELNGVDVSSLSADFDGVAIPNLSQFETKVTQYSYTLPPEPNFYDCLGAPGVTGPVNPAFAAGFFIMLAPPQKGAHTLHFAGSSPMSSPPLQIDVTYHLTVQ